MEDQVNALKTSLDKGFPGFNIAEATLGACKNELWTGTDGWQFAIARDLPVYIDPPAVGSNVTIPKLSDVLWSFEDEGALDKCVSNSL